MGADAPLFSRADLTHGLPARRASTLLFAIEALTAQLAARERRAMATYLTDRTAADQERTFLDAMRAGRTEHDRPGIRDLERHAAAWTALVPPDASLAAAMAALLAERHRFRRSDVPRLRAALRLDDPATAEAFSRQRGASIESLFAARLPLAERLRWLRAHLAWSIEDLPPFWTAFALTLTETVGGGVLALPIAVAGLGLGPALAFVVAFGLLSTVTVAALVEAITRNGGIRYGSAYMGRVVDDYLGRPAAVVLSAALFAVNALVLMFALVGVGAALGGATAIPAAVWVAALFAVNVVMLRRDSLDATVASALVIGAVNVVIVLVLAALALGHFDPSNFAPAAGGVTAGAGLVFGVLLASYFGHTSAANAAKVVLRRDPGGRSLLWGNVAAMLAVTALYVLVVVAFNGAVDHERLTGFGGTVLEPLAAEVGGGVALLGSVYAVLAMGLGTVYFSLGLANQARELLGTRSLPSRLPMPPSLAHEGAFLARAAPAIGVFAVVEALILLGSASFAGMLSFVGALTVPLLGGVFPMLLVLAARRRGEYVPRTVLAPLAHPVVVVVVALVYLAGVVVHALVVAESVPERVASLAVAVGMLIVGWVAVRRRAFRPRAVIELRREPGSGADGTWRVANAGRNVDATVQLERTDGTTVAAGGGATIRGFDALRAARFTVPLGDSREVVLWTHSVSPAGDSVPLAAEVDAPGVSWSQPDRAGQAVGRLVDGLPGPSPSLHGTVTLVRGPRTP
jgi:amino acid permease